MSGGWLTSARQLLLGINAAAAAQNLNVQHCIVSTGA
jgi:hypothetical protein